ncbi:metal-dependent hydrolase [Haloarcula onubensis]|uniref:Metal-dependent hydrolase n=1 Tax=Haloarcula onubensis TaxID=2950539 RepID=A0ABU2FK25_9EURY|nr:hypothetical protein [Halomicroarcula sp. S3CR25-11]
MYTFVRFRRLPRGHTLLLVLVATQLPDLVDKPLAWTFGVLPSGRMFAHSLVISVPVLSVGCVLAVRRGWGRPAVVFTLAYLSHIAGDFYPMLWLGTEYYFFPNLFWPLLPANPDLRPSFSAHFSGDFSSLLLPFSVFLVIVGYIALDIVRRPPTVE